jgi:hypothetical protein
MAKCHPLDARLEYQQWHLMTFGLLREPIKVSCDHCGKIILGDMEWVCGYCDAENTSTSYSFLDKCEVCKQPPKCVECPHCSELNFLVNSRDIRHPARKIRPPHTPETEEAARARKARQRDEAKAEIEHELLMTRLNAELAKLKKSTEQSKVDAKNLTPEEILQKKFLEDRAFARGIYRIAKQAREENQKQFADDPEFLEMEDEWLTSWVEDLMPGINLPWKK